jgi:hypothetical protein
MKIIILIIASNDMVHENDLQTQFKTWISNCPRDIRVIVLRGWDNDFYKFENNVLFVPCHEEYLLILKKTILGIKYILENLDFDILIRTNVSTYYEPKKLLLELSQTRYKKDFAGGYVDRSSQKVFNARNSFEYISGTGIFLSKNVAKIVSELDPENYNNIFDDIAISHYLQKQNVQIIRLPRNNMHSTHFFIPTFHIRMKNSFNPMTASVRMKLVHDFFQSKKFYQKLCIYIKICSNEFTEYINSSESFHLYYVRNRIVINSFIKLKKQRIFQTKLQI